MSCPIDRVTVLRAGGGAVEYTAVEFLSLPLHTRVRNLLEGRVKFYNAGHLVDPQEALDQLRAWAADEKPSP